MIAASSLLSLKQQLENDAGMKNTIRSTIRCLHFLGAIRLEAGGVVRAVIDTIEQISASGIHITLVTHDSKDCPIHWKDGSNARIQVVTIPHTITAPLWINPDLQRQIDGLIANHDIIHLHTAWERLNPCFASVASKHRKPYIVTLHGMLDDWCMSQKSLKKRIYHKFFGRKMLEKSDAVHCTAEAEAEQSRKWYPAGRSIIIPCIVDLSPYDPPPTARQRLGVYKAEVFLTGRQDKEVRRSVQ